MSHALAGGEQAGERDDGAERPRRAVGEGAEQAGAGDPRAILQRADERGDGSGAARVVRHRAADGIGDHEPVHGGERE